MKARDFHEHHCFTALLVVEADPAIPFAGGIVTATSTDDTLCLDRRLQDDQEAASAVLGGQVVGQQLVSVSLWPITRRGPRGCTPREVTCTTLEQNDNELFTHTTGSYL